MQVQISVAIRARLSSRRWLSSDARLARELQDDSVAVAQSGADSVVSCSKCALKPTGV